MRGASAVPAGARTLQSSDVEVACIVECSIHFLPLELQLALAMVLVLAFVAAFASSEVPLKCLTFMCGSHISRRLRQLTC
ncbi:uncharacterized protein DMAD_08156 [Drosophila madeirensis]|uniref:Uncharacterized protein n=1 Tax=Drosophila madeirensis TaxID=30013 RepID=A0AAU9EQY8_DROMD